MSVRDGLVRTLSHSSMLDLCFEYVFEGRRTMLRLSHQQTMIIWKRWRTVFSDVHPFLSPSSDWDVGLELIKSEINDFGKSMLKIRQTIQQMAAHHIQSKIWTQIDTLGRDWRFSPTTDPHLIRPALDADRFERLHSKSHLCCPSYKTLISPSIIEAVRDKYNG